MTFTPGYGETPITDEEAEALLPGVREALGEPIRKADVYDLEQAIAEEVAEERATAVISGAVGLEELLTEHFIRDLHTRLYGDIWQWAGRFRRRDMNIGVPFAQIAVELRMSFDSILYRWEHTADWTARELGIAVHAETHSLMGTGASRACSPIWCFSRPSPGRCPSSTTGKSTSRSTSPCCVSST